MRSGNEKRTGRPGIICRAILFLAALTLTVLTGSKSALALTKGGSVGENVDYSLDTETGILTITGSGDMFNYDNGCSPLDADKESIQKVVIEEGVTNVGASLFWGFDNLEQVRLPKSLKEIRPCAFQNCEKLAAVSVYEGLTSIKDYAFYGCKALTSINLPQSLEEIEYCSFMNSGLTRVTIPPKVQVIGNSAFNECTDLSAVNFTTGGELIEIDQTAFGYCTSLKKVSIPEGVTFVYESFEGCTALEQVWLPKSIETLGWGTFKGCTKLYDVNLPSPNSLKEIDPEVFSGTKFLSDKLSGNYAKWQGFLLALTDSGKEKTTFTFPSDIKGIAGYAFHKDMNLKELELPSTIKYVGYAAFDECKNLTKVTIQPGVEQLGSSAFGDCTGLTTITLPAGMIKANNRVFHGCRNLETIVFPESMVYFEEDAFYGTKWLSDRRKENPVVIVNNCVIDGKTATGTVNIPEGVTAITESAFYESNVKEVILPKTLNRLDKRAFFECKRLTKLDIPEGVTKLTYDVLYNNEALVSVTIPESVTEIAGGFLYGSKNLTTIYGVAGSRAETFTAEYNQRYKKSVQFVPIKKEEPADPKPADPGKTDPSDPSGGQGGEPAPGTSETQDSYKGDTKVKTVTLPDSLKAVKAEAFAGCISLKSVTFGPNTVKFGKNLFKGCKKIKTIVFKSAKVPAKKQLKNIVKSLPNKGKKVTAMVPAKKLSKYKAALKKAGFKGKVKASKK